jgi:hypothetical protein
MVCAEKDAKYMTYRYHIIRDMKLLQDSQDPNPLIRALAVRTMGCIRVDKITEYLCDPLQRCLKVFLRSSRTLFNQADPSSI